MISPCRSSVPKQKWHTEFRHLRAGAQHDLSRIRACLGRSDSASDIFIGVNAIDYSGYPDCRPEFIQAFENLANLATKAGVEGRRFEIHTPLIKFSKAEIIHKAIELGVDLSLTHSCYDPTPEGLACGECDSCQLRLKGFREAGIEDPIGYVKIELPDGSCCRSGRSEQSLILICSCSVCSLHHRAAHTFRRRILSAVTECQNTI